MKFRCLIMLSIVLISIGCNRTPKYTQAQLEALQAKELQQAEASELENQKKSAALQTEENPEEAERGRMRR